MPKQAQIDKPQCPRGHGNLTPKKTWTLKGRGSGGKLRGSTITHWVCQECNYYIRTKGETKQ